MRTIYNPLTECMQAIDAEIPKGFRIVQDMYLEWYYHSDDNKINVGWFGHPQLALDALLLALPFYKKQVSADIKKDRKRSNDRIILGLKRSKKKERV